LKKHPLDYEANKACEIMVFNVEPDELGKAPSQAN